MGDYYVACWVPGGAGLLKVGSGQVTARSLAVPRSEPESVGDHHERPSPLAWSESLGPPAGMPGSACRA